MIAARTQRSLFSAVRQVRVDRDLHPFVRVARGRVVDDVRGRPLLDLVQPVDPRRNDPDDEARSRRRLGERAAHRLHHAPAAPGQEMKAERRDQSSDLGAMRVGGAT